jgi:hypothetical protein
MKRSEMLDIISQKLSEYYVPSTPYKDGAELLLIALEGAGMQPPPILKMPNIWFRDVGDYGYSANEWEPEDEKN